MAVLLFAQSPSSRWVVAANVVGWNAAQQRLMWLLCINAKERRKLSMIEVPVMIVLVRIRKEIFANSSSHSVYV